MLRSHLLLLLAAAAVFTAGCSSSQPDCRGGTQVCAGSCVSTASDNQNCGACGNVCSAGTACNGGVCAPTCGPGLVACGTICIDPLTDMAFCGASGSCTGPTAGDACVTGEACQAGACTVIPVVTTVDLLTHQAASVAIGQPDLVTSSAPGCGAGTVDMPYGAAAFDGTYLFVSDTNGNRVHAFLGVPTADGPTPSFSLGSATCALPGTSISGSDIGLPQSVAVSGTGGSAKFLVVDNFDNRVLVFNSLPGSASASADVPVGQSDLTAFATGCAANALDGPVGVTVAGTKLVVADTNNHRVLIWNTIPAAGITNADYVLGQTASDGSANFTTCSANDDQTLPTPLIGDVTARTMNFPTDVWSDGTMLAVADTNNSRVLVWSTFPTASGQPADVVIGQADFVSFSAGLSATRLAFPSAVAGDGTHLFVADSGNHRVLGFATVPTSNGASAAIVLGQADMTHGSRNEGNGTTAAATSLALPSGLAVVGRDLIVSDTGNNRVVVYRSTP